MFSKEPIIGLLIFIFLTVPVRAQADPQQAMDAVMPPHAPAQIIVKLKGLESADDVRASVGGSVMDSYPTTGAELWHLNSLSVGEALLQLKNHPQVAYAEPDYLIQLPDESDPGVSAMPGGGAMPDDPEFYRLWGLHNTGQTGGLIDADIDAPEAWNFQTGTDVVIGVIDSGIDYSHPDLAPNMWVNPGETAGNGIDDDGNGFVDDIHGWDFVNGDNDPFDDNLHGTHVAGTIAAVGDNGLGVTGVNWSARLMALKAFDANGSGFTSHAIEAFEYAIQMGVPITNNSWGSRGFSQALYDTVALAEQAGQLVVAAAGNDGGNTDSFPHYPSGFDLDAVVSVAASTHQDQLASFSNYGAISVDLAAPGQAIYSTLPGNGYGFLSGTSMASPHVAGVAALLKSQFPSLDATGLKQRLVTLTDPVPSLSGMLVSNGRLNAHLALGGQPPAVKMTLSDLAYTVPLLPGQSIQKTLTVGNLGTGSLQWSLQESHAWLNAAPTSGTATAANPSVITLTFDSTNLVPGTGLNEIFTIASNDPEKPSLPVSVSLSVPHDEVRLRTALAEPTFFGWSVAADESLLIVGHPIYSLQGPLTGSASIFRENSGVWVEETTLFSPNPTNFEAYGWSVDIEDDLAIVGSPITQIGFIYRFVNNQWQLEQTVTDASLTPESQYGFAVAIDGDHALVGAFLHTAGATSGGAVYAYRFDGTAWQPAGTLVPAQTVVNDGFGVSISLQEDRAIIGAVGHRFNSPNTGGRAFVYEWDGTAWQQEALLQAGDGLAGDEFGFVVNMDRDAVIIGAPFQDVDSIANVGAAYLYCLKDGAWSLDHKFTPPLTHPNQWFGYGVALSQQVAVISAPADNYLESVGFTYRLSGGTWNQGMNLFSTSGDNMARLGWVVAASGDWAFFGGPAEDVGLGSVFAYERLGDGALAAVGHHWHEDYFCDPSAAPFTQIGHLVQFINQGYACPP